MEEAESRLRRQVQVFIADYLPSLTGLLADEGVERDEQIDRVDRLVRSLLDARVEENLKKRGHRIVVDVDDSEDPPVVTFNAGFVDEVDASEAIGLFEKPAVEMLDVSSLRISLVLELEDEDSLNSLANRARRGGDTNPVGLAEVPGVVEARLRLFVRRLQQFVSLFADSPSLRGEIRDGVEAVVGTDESRWPSWEVVSGSRFIRSLREQIDGDGGEMPEPATIMQLCWDSLDLSPQSFLRHAARRLRADRNGDLELTSVLRRMSEAVETPDAPISEAAETWDAFAELADSWSELFRTEQRMLAWSVVRRPTPELSVFEPPLETLHLNEPESLPWKVPLLCWSVREQNALRDLLEGHRKTAEKRLAANQLLDLQFTSESGAVSFETGEQSTRLDLLTEASVPDESEQGRRRAERAIRSCWARLYAQFTDQSTAKQGRILKTIRSGYDGYFEQGGEVWERRFQAWEDLSPEGAFKLLADELRYVLGSHAMFDPFMAPTTSKLRQIPTFSFVAPFGEEESTARIRIPLIALKSGFSEAPSRIRAIEVPDDDSEACRWVGDREITLRDLVEQPNEKVLRNIENDEVRLHLKRT
ncbi:MAG: hypothetical protein ABEN55_12815 [Bradymonadaceae bacterium]